MQDLIRPKGIAKMGTKRAMPPNYLNSGKG